MSFLSGILDIGKKVIGAFSGGGIASTLLKTVGLGLAVNQLSKNINKSNDIGNVAPNIDAGVRLQIEPNAESKIPVLYGTAYFGGNITDAQMTNNNKTMFYCLTLAEKTGTKLSDGQPSDFIFKDVYWNDQRIVFKADGITADYAVDRNGNVDRSISDLVRVYCYKGSSDSPATIENYTATNTTKAYQVMPTWTSSTHVMSDLVFSVVRVDYNRDKNVTGLGNMVFHVENTMRLPGDCIYDYMTNTRYGAGIPAAEILS